MQNKGREKIGMTKFKQRWKAILKCRRCKKKRKCGNERGRSGKDVGINTEEISNCSDMDT